MQGQGEYTIEDYLALPKGTRAELIDGFLYAMASPTPLHQLVATLMGQQLMNFVQEHGCPCIPISSPVDVQLHMDDKTMIQPDVMILCSHKEILSNKRIYGAPDFVAEILSPSNRVVDMALKLFHYIAAGVREYWLVDPERGTVVVYDLEHDAEMQMYTFRDKVPVRIWKGEYSLDFGAISDYLEKLR